jgi:hypothetical protein
MKYIKIFILIIVVCSCNSKAKSSPIVKNNITERNVLSKSIKKNVQNNEVYFVTAPNGLILRNAPNSNSNRIGKLPYGTTLKVLETTKIKHHVIDNGKELNGVWVKVKFSNFPFAISNKNLGYDGVGYVFNQFIEKLNKATIESKPIDSLHFYSLYKESKILNRVKITSQVEAEELLDSKVKWIDSEYSGTRTIDQIILDSGQKLKINQMSNDYVFVAYYPSEEIIVFEGGHSSDFSISIKTGESLETVGNPNAIVESPDKSIRLNGWFPGQECMDYFIQEKKDDTYTYLVNFGWGSSVFEENLCYYKKFCWLNNQEFIYSYISYSGGKAKEAYVICKINKIIK